MTDSPTPQSAAPDEEVRGPARLADWSPESDPDHVTRDDLHMKDWVLTTFINTIVGTDDEHRGSASLTVQSNGATISGVIISAGEYFERAAESISKSGATEFADALAGLWTKLRADTAEWRAEREAKDLPIAARRYLHMRDVLIFTGNRYLDMDLWRGTLADVTGWSFGSVSRDGD